MKALFRVLVALSAAAGALVFAASALGNAANPVANSTVVDQVVINANGSETVTVHGQWEWDSQSNCPSARNGVGYQVDWFDNQTNAIGQNNSPNGILYVGTANDNIVHSDEGTSMQGGVVGNLMWDGVPSSYAPVGGGTNTTPTSTDAANWFGTCPSSNPPIGQWGPISHTYAASATQPLQLCPIMYDPHGGSANSGKSAVKDIIAGANASSNNYNNDNSYETNGTGPNGNQCPVVKLPTLTTSASPSSGTVGQKFHDMATLTNSSGTGGTISWSLFPAGSGCTGTALFTDSMSAPTDNTYTNPNAYTPTNAGTYQWQASYSSSVVKGLITSCSSPSEQFTVTGTPAISLVKAERIGSSGFTHGPVTGNPGDTVNYQMTVSNTGSTSLTLNFTDAHCDTGTLSGPSPALTGNTLPVGASVQYTCSHKLTSGDAPSFTNTANVVGTAPDGTQVNASDSVVANVQLTPGILVVKAERIGSSGPFVHGPVTGQIGETVNYQITVSNTGNVAESYTFSDPECDPNTLSGPTPALTNNQLAVGQSVVYTCSHKITSSDTASGYTNTACATSGANQSCDTVLTNVPAISLVKAERIGSSGFTHGPVTGNPADTVDYQMTVSNTGSTPLTLNFTDANCDTGTLSGPSPALANNTLAVGASVHYTCSHKLASGDAPSFTNTANVVGTAPDGTQVNASDSVVANVQLTPGIKVVKLQRDGTSGTFTSSDITASVGDTIYYEIQATNTGNEPLTLKLDDPNCDSGTVAGPSSVNGTLNGDKLSPHSVAQFTCWHVVSASDIPSFTNVGTITGTPPFGPPVSGHGTVVANITQAGIQVVKLESNATAGAGAFVHGPISFSEVVGHYVVQTIDYEIQVTNTGNVDLSLSIDDPHCDSNTLQGPTVLHGTLSGGILSPGGEAQYTCSHQTSQSDPAAFFNTATVTGTPPSGPPVSGHDTVEVDRKSSIGGQKVCRTPSGKKIVYHGTKKPEACEPAPKKPKHPHGFTG